MNLQLHSILTQRRGGRRDAQSRQGHLPKPMFQPLRFSAFFVFSALKRNLTDHENAA
jgi:hypothetical protein